MKHSNGGFTAIEIALIAATVVVIGFVGFAIYQASHDIIEVQEPLIDMPAFGPADDIPESLDVENEEDLEEAKTTLSDMDLDRELESDSDLESESENF